MEDMDHLRRFSGGDLMSRLSELVASVADHSERIILDHDGRVVALVCVEDLDYLERADRIQDEQDMVELNQRTPEDRETVPLDEVLAELGELDSVQHVTRESK
ncbi:MAG: hypothetical protein HY000_25230 [Planctomycetes bacterium]|nr:hypothetical protein [Planctomycetota bacterium]